MELGSSSTPKLKYVVKAVRRRIAKGIDAAPEFIPWHGEGKIDY